MNKYNAYIPLDYTVTLDVSLGNLAGASDYSSKNNNNTNGTENVT